MNGWTNYESWNVALWIDNDEDLYNLAKDCVKESLNAVLACDKFVKILDSLGFGMIRTCTHDGVVIDYNNSIEYFKSRFNELKEVA